MGVEVIAEIFRKENKIYFVNVKVQFSLFMCTNMLQHCKLLINLIEEKSLHYSASNSNLLL